MTMIPMPARRTATATDLGPIHEMPNRLRPFQWGTLYGNLERRTHPRLSIASSRRVHDEMEVCTREGAWVL